MVVVQADPERSGCGDVAHYWHTRALLRSPVSLGAAKPLRRDDQEVPLIAEFALERYRNQ